MEWTPHTRWVAQFAAAVLVIIVTGLAVVDLRARHDGNAPEVKPENSVGRSAPISEIQPAPAKPPAIEVTPFDPNDSVAFATLADAAVAELHDGITLQQWEDSQSNSEDWHPSKDEAFFDCRTLLKTETLASGRQVRHTVYFYPPEAPTPAVFPTASGEDLINRDCKLAMVRVQTAASTDRDGHAFEQGLQEQFVKKYGESLGMKGTHYQRSTAAARWIADSEIVSAYDAQPQPTSEDSDGPSGGAVFVFARLPIVHELEEDTCCRITEHYHSIEDSQFRQALGIAAADAGLTARVATLFAHLFRRIGPGQDDPPELEDSREALLPALREWLNAVKTLPPLRHAAGLYVADRLLVAASDDGWPNLIVKEKTDLRSTFEKLGASFSYEELGGCYNYSGNWLEESRELDPNGQVGQMAVLIALARGSAPKLPKDKDQQLDIFHTVVSDGEWLLAKKPDPATAAQIHFIIGDAYSDIVALAGGAEPDYGDPTEYQPEADSARKRALEHYRVGLAADGSSDNAKCAWLQAWKISAGLLPRTRYVYIND
jgi:hypothetical protein